ncbi:MAG TPA: hypothetical protein VMR70_19170 [Flavisolibacter sp.]|nr:hypothetical protein [Flavisolibacter sp.]
MKTTLLQFVSLPELAEFVQLVNPPGYLLDTQALTIRGRFSKEQVAMALKQWNAMPLAAAFEGSRKMSPYFGC